MLKLRAGPGCAARQSCLQASRCTCECPAVTLLLVMLNRFLFFFFTGAGCARFSALFGTLTRYR